MDKNNISIVKKFSNVGAATIFSRVLGFARELVIAATLGTSIVADAFYAALTLPNVFRRIFAEGAFSIAFVPTYADILKQEGEDRAKDFSNRVYTMLAITLIVLTGLVTLIMPFVISNLLVPGFSEKPEKLSITISFATILFPYIFLVSIAAFISSILNVRSIYFIPALAPAILNIVLVTCGAAAYFMGYKGTDIGFILSYGVIFSGLIQVFLLLLVANKLSLFPKFAYPKIDPDIKKVMRLMLPAIMTGGVVQINILVGRIIASGQEGAIAVLNFSDRIYQLPLGVIGIAVGVVLLPELSKALASKQWKLANELQNVALQFSMFFTILAAFGLIILAEPIVNVLYERGIFDSKATILTAQALIGFSLGLPAYVTIKIFQSGYFARQDTKTPLVFAGVSVIFNIGLSLLLFPLIGHVAIALGTSISAWVNVLLLAIILIRRGDFKINVDTLRRLKTMIIAGILMLVSLYVFKNYVYSYPDGSIFIRAIYLSTQISLGAVIYLTIVSRFSTFSLRTMMKRLILSN